jgi:polyvinyl alcohol dehydrogenase (cytochrome)
MIGEAPKPTNKNSNGIQLWAPAGGAIWGSPAIDIQGKTMYVSTGNSYTAPAAENTDSIVALNLDTGKILWSIQDTPNDPWISGCPPSTTGLDNCPEDLGPDYDFSSSVILKTLQDGNRLLIAGQKSGIVWAHNPDKAGALVWKTDVSRKRPGPQGELVWGGAADSERVYFGVNSGGLVGLRLTDGAKEWFTPLDPVSGRPRGNSAALTAIPGVVFSNGWDGVVRAFSADKGELLWEYDTVHEYQSVNGVKTKGGSMAATGPTVADGMVFVGSGYIGFQNGIPGNAVLAFSVQ